MNFWILGLIKIYAGGVQVARRFSVMLANQSRDCGVAGNHVLTVSQSQLPPSMRHQQIQYSRVSATVKSEVANRE